MHFQQMGGSIQTPKTPTVFKGEVTTVQNHVHSLPHFQHAQAYIPNRCCCSCLSRIFSAATRYNSHTCTVACVSSHAFRKHFYLPSKIYTSCTAAWNESPRVSLQVAGCAEGSSALAAPERLLSRLNSQVELQVAVAGCGTATLFKRVCLDGWLVLLPDRGRALPTRARSQMLLQEQPPVCGIVAVPALETRCVLMD